MDKAEAIKKFHELRAAAMRSDDGGMFLVNTIAAAAVLAGAGLTLDEVLPEKGAEEP